MSARGALGPWRVALLAGLVLGVVLGCTEGFSLFSLRVSDDLDVSRGQATGLFAAYLLTCTVAGPIAGKLADRFGPRRVILGAFPVFAAGIGACSIVTRFWHLYVSYLGLIAVPATVLTVASGVLVNNSYGSDRGRAIGISFAGLGTGNMIMFVYQGFVIEQFGWRAAYLGTAIVACMGGVAFGLLSRELPCSTTTKVAKDTEFQPISRSAGGRALVFLCIAAFAASIIDFVVFQHVVPFLESSGVATHAAGIVLGVTSAGYVVGHLGSGILSDKYGREYVGICAGLLFIVGIGVVWSSSPIVVVAVGTAVLGCSVGGVIGCRTAAVGDLFAGGNLGRVSGIIQVASAGGAAFGTWMGGVVFDVTGGYGLTFATTIGFTLVWMVALWISAPRRRASGKIPYDAAVSPAEI